MELFDEDDSHSVINPNARPSYVDNGHPESPELFDFNCRVMKKLSAEFAAFADDYDEQATEKIRTYLRIRPPSTRSLKLKPTEAEEVKHIT